ncbi:MAG: hypothetical protein ACRD8O_23130 [Bryobacteraceae bacterium]
MGLVWLWLQKGRPIPAKFGGSALVVLWSLVWLGMIFLLMKPLGLRFQLDGTGIVPRFFTFKPPDALYSELEKNRAQQSAVKSETGSGASVPAAANGRGLAGISRAASRWSVRGDTHSYRVAE